MELTINPKFRDLLPCLAVEEKALLEASILQDGCREALIIWNGTIVDGHNRYEICTRHAIEFNVLEMEFADEEEAMDWIDKNQIARRNLTEDARRLAIGRRYNRTKKQGARTDLTSGHFDHKSTAQQIALEHGVSEKTIRRDGAFATLVEQTPELHAAIMNNVPVKNIIKEQNRQEKMQDIRQAGTLPDAHYPVIYADPPWRYDYSVSSTRDIENQYPTLALEDICNIPVESIACDNAVLFLWTTSPKLEESLKVIAAWGFSYRTCAVWNKEIIGMGYYFRQQHELLLVATRGSLPAPSPESRPSSIIDSKRQQHSKKPDCVYEIIDAMYPGFNKIELFARQAYDGWSTWGNQDDN